MHGKWSVVDIWNNVQLDSLFKEGLSLTFMVVVHQLQIHVDKKWVEDLGQFGSVTVQYCFYELLEVTVVDPIKSWISLLVVSWQYHTDIWLVLCNCWWKSPNEMGCISSVLVLSTWEKSFLRLPICQCNYKVNTTLPFLKPIFYQQCTTTAPRSMIPLYTGDCFLTDW